MIFEDAVRIVLAHEGGYSNDRTDPGGETNYGISKRSYPTLDIRLLSRDEAVAIYKRDYWDRINGDILKNKLRLIAFDCAVNQGVESAIRNIQQLLNVFLSGRIDEPTLAALELVDEETFVARFAARRMAQYTLLKNWPRFGGGWSKRLLDISLKSITDKG